MTDTLAGSGLFCQPIRTLISHFLYLTPASSRLIVERAKISRKAKENQFVWGDGVRPTGHCPLQ